MASELQGLPYNATWQERIYYSFEVAEKTCSVPGVLDYEEPLPGLHITFHVLMTILAAVATMITCLVTLYTTCGHLFHWVNAREQRQIVRIIWFLPLFAVANFFSLWFYNSEQYISPIPQLYNVFALVSSFYLYVVYIVPDEATWDGFFVNLERLWPTGKRKHGRGSLRWFRLMWVLVFQLIPTQVTVTIIQEVHAITSCPLSTTNQIWDGVLESFQFVTVSTAGTAVFFFYLRFRRQLDPKHVIYQITVISTIVTLQVAQQLTFTLTASYKVYLPTQYVSFRDYAIGVPALILCWETAIFSIFFFQAFHYGEYSTATRQGTKRAGDISAALREVFNISDIIRGTVYMWSILVPCAPLKSSPLVKEKTNRDLPMVEGGNRINGNGEV